MVDNKYLCFLENAKMLNEHFSISPLLYGSLGLEIIAEINLNSDDIDILIPEVYVKGAKWLEFRSFLEENGYQLIDEHEHTFRKDMIDYSYASIENLEEFAGVLMEDIKEKEYNSTKYKILSLEQYLKVYEKSSLDGYRINKKEKKDNEKIMIIKEKLGIE